MGRVVSLRRRLLRQLLLLALLPVSALSLVGVLLLMPALVTHGEERNRELATSVREQVRLLLLMRQQAAEQLAAAIGRGGLAASDIAQSLQTLVASDRSLQAAYLTNARGIVTHVALPSDSALHRGDLLGLDQSAQPYLQAAVRTRRATWSETFLSTLTGQVTAVLVVPAGQEHVLVEFSLAGLSQSLAGLDRSGQTQTVVLDRAGRIIGHADAARALRQESLRALPLVEGAIGGQGQAGRIRLEGQDHLAYALPVPDIGWTILVSQHTAAVLQPLWRLGWVLGGTLALTLAAAALAAWWLSRRAGLEVERLADAARHAVFGAPDQRGLRFDTAEFADVWARLRSLFAELRLRDEQTRAAQHALQSVLDAATEVAIVATDTAGQVTLFSAGAQKMLRRTPEQVVGQATPALWHDADELAARGAELTQELGRPVAGFEALVAHARQGGHEVRDWTFVRVDGQRLRVSLAVTSVRDPGGRLRGFLGVAIDISHRRRAEALELAQRSALAASQAKTEFLSRMSHELRSPLNAMLGYAQLLELDTQEPAAPGQRARAQQIQRAGWHLVQLIDDVLDLSRIESGQMRVSIEPVDLQVVAARAAELSSAVLARHGVRLALRGLGDAAAAGPVLADATRLSQVLVNLIGNAAKYSRPDASVVLEAEALADERVALRVIDSGRGMTPQQMAQLFQPFNRLGLETSGIEGTGIGLVITQRLVALMQGRLDVDSRVGEGSRFTVTLPRGGLAAAPPPPPGPMPADAARLRGRVLYIEDNEVNALLMREILRQRPLVELFVAGSVAEGLSLARQHLPQLVLLDMHLPDAHGSVALDAIRADPRLQHTAVIVVSADATRQQIVEMGQRGARGYLTKPIKVPETLAAVDAVLAAQAADPLS